MKILYNPQTGAEIKNFKSFDNKYYTIKVGDKGQFDDTVAKHLKATFDFLIYLDEGELIAEAQSLASELKAFEDIDLNKADIEVILSKKKLLEKKIVLEKKLAILGKNKIDEFKPSDDIKTEEMSRGELIVKCRELGYTDEQLKGKRVDSLINMVKEKK